MKDFKLVELKWQKYWGDHPEISRANDRSDKEKKYVLVEFPYPSGSGLHVGHAFSFTGGDVYARFCRMMGNNVLFPMGWDAFGLPTENYAIKMKRKPQEITKENTDHFRNQMKKLAYSFDWKREIDTTDPDYYRWTQWIFIQLFKEGLAYKKEMPINWCSSCKIGLANEEVVDGKCERCGTEVCRKNISQWVVKITEYADKLIEGLKGTEFIDKVKQSQINWIGRSEGARVKFLISNNQFLNKSEKNYLEVFTTKPDTLFGVTFMVIAPEHSLVNKVLSSRVEVPDLLSLQKKIGEYVLNARKKSEMERVEFSRDKSGVFSGLYAVNPVNNRQIPIWISDFVLASYGTGAIMSVPAHDERDFAFAMKFNLPIIPVIKKKYSFAKSCMVGCSKITDEDLISIGIKIIEKTDSGARKIEIPEGSLGKYESLVTEKMDKGFWNEYLGEEIVFLFKNYKGIIKRIVLNQKTERRINDLVFEFMGNNNRTERTGVWSWLADEKFYIDRILINDVDNGEMINSELIKGMAPLAACEKIVKWLEEKELGERTVSYHLRDWVFSRQHYWGEPIPMIKCPKCGWLPVPDEQLPVVLPEVEAYEPTDDGKSPLSKIETFVKCQCPVCGGGAERETDTMPNWAGSDWYFLGYILADKIKGSQAISSHNDIFSDSQKELRYWSPVDIYIGGDEHNVLHLLYSRFIYKFLWDLGILPKENPEPYFKRISHGVILGTDNQRMSKSKGNVIVPDVVIDKYGVDVLRMYLMFMGPFDATMAWNEKTLIGVKRFLDRFEYFIKSQNDNSIDSSLEVKLIINKLIKGVTVDVANFKYNTAIAKIMEALNSLSAIKPVSLSLGEIRTLLKLVAPFAPYTAEELWSFSIKSNKNYSSVHLESWPIADERYLVEDEINLPVAVNGKVRGEILVKQGELNNKELVLSKARIDEKISKWIGKNNIIKEIYIPGKMINLVIG